MFISYFSVESLYDVTKLKDLFSKAKMARCRSRFVVPVILFEGKVKIDHVSMTKTFLTFDSQLRIKSTILTSQLFFFSIFAEVRLYLGVLKSMVDQAWTFCLVQNLSNKWNLLQNPRGTQNIRDIPVHTEQKSI